MIDTFLIADDDGDDSSLFCEALHSIDSSIVCHTAENGQDALNILLRERMARPQLVFLDINMPVMDGFSFIEAFRRISLPRKEDITIVIVTSSHDAKDMARAKMMGIAHYLTKPLSEESLLRILEL